MLLSQHQEDHGFTRGCIGPLVRDGRPEGAFGAIPRLPAGRQGLAHGAP